MGHEYATCKLPIISYGIILFRVLKDKEPEYLMVRRRNSFGFTDLMRGKFSFSNCSQIQLLINEMSSNERHILQTNEYCNAWKTMWDEINSNSYDVNVARKVETLKTGFIDGDGNNIALDTFIQKSDTNWTETEWEFPKGRRNSQEKDLQCALREFEEETGISRNKITLISNMMPFEETFFGTNYKCYKHKYYLATLTNPDEDISLENYQTQEVSKLEWKTLTKCLEDIRPYNIEKQKLITAVNTTIYDTSLIVV
jgi:8-oxo-dGTP pyrophosphatase MutT (NUDIX family)